MYKKTLLTILSITLFASFQLFGQKMMGSYISFERYNMPSEPLPKEFKTYSVSLSGGERTLAKMGLTPEQIMKDYFTLVGLKRVQFGGDLHFEIRLGEYIEGQITTETNETTVTDTSGVARKKRNYYISMEYEFLVDIKMLSGNTEAIPRGEMSRLEKMLSTSNISSQTATFGKSSNYATKAELMKAWQPQRAEIIANRPYDHLSSKLKTFRDRFKRKHGVYAATEKIYLWRVHRKNENSEAWTKAFRIVKEVLPEMKASEPVDEIREKLQPAIDIWLELKDLYPVDNKKTRKGQQCLLHNLAVVHYALDDLEKASLYADECLNNKGGSYGAWTKQVVKKIDETQAQFTASGWNTRHIVTDYDNAAFVVEEGMGRGSAVASANSGSLDAAGKFYNGFVEMKNGELIPGIIQINPKSPMRNQKSIRYISPDSFIEGKVHQSPNNKTYTPEDIAGFSCGERKFKPALASLLGGKKKATLHFLEVLEGGKITIYKYWVPHIVELTDLRKLNNLDAEAYETYRVQKDDGHVEDFESIDVAAYFEDAPPVWEKMKEGAYGNNFKDKKRGKLGRFLYNEGIDIGDLHLIVRDYNKYFREKELPKENIDVSGFGEH